MLQQHTIINYVDCITINWSYHVNQCSGPLSLSQRILGRQASIIMIVWVSINNRSYQNILSAIISLIRMVNDKIFTIY